MMEEFDDQLPARRFDNFQFVEYNAVMQVNKKNPEAGFAIVALMEIPGAFLRYPLAVHVSIYGLTRINVTQCRAIPDDPPSRHALIDAGDQWEGAHSLFELTKVQLYLRSVRISGGN